jgi:hypothetical protein
MASNQEPATQSLDSAGFLFELCPLKGKRAPEPQDFPL